MTIHPTNLKLPGAKDDPHRSLSRDSSENGVSSRVEASRKRLRMIRADKKGPIETVEPVTGNSVACNVEACTEM